MRARLWPTGLIGRVGLVLLAAVVLELVASTFVFEQLELVSSDDSQAGQVAERLETARRVLGVTDPANRAAVAHTLSDGDLTLAWAATPPSRSPADGSPRLRKLRAQLIAAQPGLDRSGLALQTAPGDAAGTARGSLRLADGSALAFTASRLGGTPPSIYGQLGSMAVLSACVLLAALLVVRTLTAPLRMMVTATDAIGQGPAIHLDDTQGPGEIRRVARAFNAMQARIEKLVKDRTDALAAVSHDLRTPIARMKLRADLAADADDRAAFGDDLAEMEAMLADLNSFLRGESDPEAARRTDIATMLQTLVDDATDAGKVASYSGPDHLVLEVRALAVKRACANILGNAIAYGDRAGVTLAAGGNAIAITVEDDGPGIPEVEQEAVFTPFYRGDASRNRAKGGMGLGLAIARQAIRREGGTISLANRAEGGLRVSISLPRRAPERAGVVQQDVPRAIGGWDCRRGARRRPMDVATRAWTQVERELWSRIEAHAFDKSDIALDFTRRFARQMGWPLETAREGVGEYRKFCFLAMVTTQGPVTPSEEVDEVWHLHLTYSRDYWERWCGEALGQRLHHDPTEGGPAEQARYRAQYAETLALYEAYFGPPPAAFWPSTAQRFAARPRFSMVDSRRALIVRRPTIRLGRLVCMPAIAAILSLVAGTPAVAETDWTMTWNSLDWTGRPFLELYVCLLVASVVVAILLRAATRTTHRLADVGNLASLDVAFLLGGQRRAVDTLLLEMAARGGARLDEKGVEIGASARELPPSLEPFRSIRSGRYKRAELVRMFSWSPVVDGLRSDLRRRNLMMTAEERVKMCAAIVLAMTPVLVLGIAKVCVGVSRDKPVGFLVFLITIGVGLVFILIFKDRDVTREGEAVLRDLRTRSDRMIRAPRGTELPLAFAFVGASVLAGSEFAAYAKLVRADGGGGCGGDGGGGCGGGGCGGCGGG